MPAQVRKEENIAETLAAFAHDLSYEDLPEEVRDMAKTRILDALGSALAGRDLPHSRAAVEMVKGRKGDSTVLGHRFKAPVLDAALVNAVLTHSIFYEDMILRSSHPGTMVIPAVVAVGENEGSSGRQTVVAVVLGYELMARIFRALGGLRAFITSPFRPGPIVGTFGAAAASGRLMKLDKVQLIHTLGFASALTPGTHNQCWWDGSMEGMFQAGFSAQTGIQSANLARAGATAARQALEGKHGFFRCWSGTGAKEELATEDLGKTYLIMRTVIKPYPACGANQLPIQTSLPLSRYGLKADDIIKVIERIHTGATDYAGNDFAGPFANHLQAGMSLQFCAAATILGRPVTSFHFYAENFDDPEVLKLAKKVELVCEEGRTKPRFEVYTRDGEVYVAEEETLDRTIHTPTRENMEEKFRRLASDFLGKEGTDRVIDTVMNLERLDDIRKLTALLVQRPGAPDFGPS